VKSVKSNATVFPARRRRVSSASVGLKIVIFGATGMLGQGVLRECLQSPSVESVLTVGRAATGRSDPKLREIVHADLTDLTSIEGDLTGLDACFFCLGVSSAGMSEAEYTRVTYDYTLSVARTVARLNPGMVFTYISGAGTDSTERSRTMWARVKGKTENDILALRLDAYMFRPGYVQPRYGATSRASMYRVLYAVFKPLYPVIKRVAPGSVSTTEHIGRAMVRLALNGKVSDVPPASASNRILDSRAINILGSE
jgi:uncharacterized protein YbjT (DUF2867 family)